MSGVEAGGLRQSFDQAFAVLPPPPPALAQRLLAFRLAGDRYALDLRELSGLEQGRHVTPLPGRVPGRIGLAGVHGFLVPVYSLAELLGYEAPGEERIQPVIEVRWLALCPLGPGGGEQGRSREGLLGLSIVDLDGYLQVPRDHILATSSERGARAHVTGVAQVDGQAVSVVSVASILEGVKKRSPIPRKDEGLA